MWHSVGTMGALQVPSSTRAPCGLLKPPHGILKSLCGMCRHCVDFYSLYAYFTNAMCAVTRAVWTVISSMNDANALCVTLHPLCGLLHPLCVLLHPTCVVHRS